MGNSSAESLTNSWPDAPNDMGIFRLARNLGQTKKESNRKRPTPSRRDFARAALGVVAVLVLSLLLSLHLLPDQVSLQIGDVSPVEIRAHRTVRYVDSVETERLREEAASRADKVYKVVPRAASEAAETASNIFDTIRRARIDRSLSSNAAKTAYVKNNLRFEIPDSALTTLLTTDTRSFEQIEGYTIQLIRELMEREIRDDTDEAQQARAEFSRRAANYFGSSKHAAAAAQIASPLIRANRIFDIEATKSAAERERRSVPEQYRRIFLGEVVINKGERVTPEHIDKFMALGLRRPRIDWMTVLCITLLVTFIVMLVGLYLIRYHRRIFNSTKLIFLLTLIVIISALGLKLGGTMLGLHLSGEQFGYFTMIWTATAGMLTAVLLDPQLAVLVVALLSTASGLAMNHELRWALAGLVSSLAAVYVVSDIRHRSDLIRAAIAVCMVNLAMIWFIGRISGDDLDALLVGSGWAVAGGIGSVMLFWFGTAALEKPFGITTHIRLLELSDTNNPMLKRLLLEAPGTYSHSIFVGRIAETAAEMIGANALLVRAASYYHDVGKMKRPHFFVENQYVENIHDRLNPSLSALVIRSHIKDGLELAREYKLPPAVTELMAQHHGTSLVRYFYNQAAGDGGSETLALEGQFRYEGKKPQSKEAALIMLADSVEAASRALAKPTIGQIEDMVEAIIAEKLTDGQLDESELTFRDISIIRNSFIRSVTSMLHARIEYPEMPATEGKKSGTNGSIAKESSESAGKPEKSSQSRQEIPTG